MTKMAQFEFEFIYILLIVANNRTNAAKLLRWANVAFHKDFEKALCYGEFPFFSLFFVFLLSSSQQ